MFNLTNAGYRKIGAAAVLLLIAALVGWSIYQWVSPSSPPPPLVEEVTP